METRGRAGGRPAHHPFAAVLIDWRGTLVLPPTEQEWVHRALQRLGRDPASAPAILQALTAAQRDPAVRDADMRADCSVAEHRAAYELLFSTAELDDELAQELYAAESDVGTDAYADDAAETLRSISEAGIKVCVVSDIHVDIRPTFDAQGLRGWVDFFVLSFEHGVQKPDAAIFGLALDSVDVTADRALMVGDRAGWDGGAVELGIATLLVPPLRSTADRRLSLVLRLLGLD